ncbi:MAG: radical SAM protein [Fibromonadaceae bacterium]|jgi:wyosine [tRNA(Phe)-imidazoG37] synthetase (radical SAM superfamily)|nr:radical SAM protein [Fibromonadaceae bacterium]
MSTSELMSAWADHNRKFENFNYVYPVISRRAKGLSIGINCTPNGICSLDCVYCQVNKKNLSTKIPSVDEIIFELKEILYIYHKTKLSEHFPRVEEKNRELKDIALSGDGEPTLYPYFAELCKQLKGISEIPKLVLITNAMQLEKILDFSGEIWGKLDAGTDEWFYFINRPKKKIKVELIENNLKFAVSKFPLRIQTMLCEANGRIPSETDIESYAGIVQRVHQTNPENLLSVQLYSVVRQTVENSVKPLSREFLEGVKNILQKKISNLNIEVF